jgi:hypothetical protein
MMKVLGWWVILNRKRDTSRKLECAAITSSDMERGCYEIEASKKKTWA